MNFPKVNQESCARTADTSTGTPYQLVIVDGQLGISTDDPTVPEIPNVSTHPCNVVPDFPDSFPNDPQTYTAVCPNGSTGNSVTVTIPAGAVQSGVSVEEANATALQQARAQAQAQLVCLWHNTEIKVTCPEGESWGYAIVPAGTVSSTVSQADADQQAINLANLTLVCDQPGDTGCALSLTPQWDPALFATITGTAQAVWQPHSFIGPPAFTIAAFPLIPSTTNGLSYPDEASGALVCRVAYSLMKTPGSQGSLVAQIYSDNNGLPGTLLGESDAVSLVNVPLWYHGHVGTTTPLPIEFSIAATLNPAETYWFALKYQGFNDGTVFEYQNDYYANSVVWCGNSGESNGVYAVTKDNMVWEAKTFANARLGIVVIAVNT